MILNLTQDEGQNLSKTSRYAIGTWPVSQRISFQKIPAL